MSVIDRSKRSLIYHRVVSTSGQPGQIARHQPTPDNITHPNPTELNG
nr:MAG TPA: hypothetical protein [Caudoviricetes sp.]